jgi:hypothetical protein
MSMEGLDWISRTGNSASAEARAFAEGILFDSEVENLADDEIQATQNILGCMRQNLVGISEGQMAAHGTRDVWHRSMKLSSVDQGSTLQLCSYDCVGRMARRNPEKIPSDGKSQNAKLRTGGSWTRTSRNPPESSASSI